MNTIHTGAEQGPTTSSLRNRKNEMDKGKKGSKGWKEGGVAGDEEESGERKTRGRKIKEEEKEVSRRRSEKRFQLNTGNTPVTKEKSEQEKGERRR